MTDRHAGYVVTLEQDIREDDAADILTAIGMIRGVVSCEPVRGGSNQHIAEERVRRELEGKLWKLLRGER